MQINSKMGRVEIKNRIKEYYDQNEVYKTLKLSIKEDDYDEFLSDLKKWIKTKAYKCKV